MNLVRVFLQSVERSQCLVVKRFAGHSKWANIKHTKMANDSARAKLFMRYGHQIRLCIQEKGDSNPETNRSLAQIIESAKRVSMPMSSIQNSIKVAQGKVKSEECFFEIKGPKGCFIIASVITDNRKKTKDTIATILRKNNVSFTENVARGMFTLKAMIEAQPPEGVKELDEIVEHAIESGAEDVSPTESNSYLFYSDPINLETTKKGLESLNYKILEAENHFLPNTQVSLSDSDLVAVEKLCDKLEEHPDVVKLYDNIA